MPDLLSLPSEITLHILRCMFQDNLSEPARSARSRIRHKPHWSELWFSTFVVQKTSDLTYGVGLFPGLPSWAHQLIISISSSWGVADLSGFAHFRHLKRVDFAEHNDQSPAQSTLFLVEALQRLPRAHLTHLSCSFADAVYLRSTWPYFGEFPQLEELRLGVCNPMSCPRRPRLTRLTLSDVRMPLLEESDIGLMAQALRGFPKLRALHIGVFTISQGSFLMHWGLHESARRNNPSYDPWASDCKQCRTDAMPEALRRAELAALSLAKAAPSLRHVEWLSWFAPMKEGTVAFDVTRGESSDLISVNSILYMF